jgi:hypothetical protein
MNDLPIFGAASLKNKCLYAQSMCSCRFVIDMYTCLKNKTISWSYPRSILFAHLDSNASQYVSKKRKKTLRKEGKMICVCITRFFVLPTAYKHVMNERNPMKERAKLAESNLDLNPALKRSLMSRLTTRIFHISTYTKLFHLPTPTADR